MKKGEIYTGKVERVDFPNKGIVICEEGKVIVKNTIPGQTVRFMINKKKGERCEGRLLVSARFDNLGKGASGAAIQNMNILLGIDESTGLHV